jgi:DnaJ like chaperone protein
MTRARSEKTFYSALSHPLKGARSKTAYDLDKRIYSGLPMPDKRQTIREAFLTGAFRFLGYIAHCDGPINREEIERLKVHMKKMHLSENEQRRALSLFKAATAPEFDARRALQEFRSATTPKLIQILLIHLVAMARADGYLMEKELHALQWIARELGYKSIVFPHLLKMIYTQDQLALSIYPPKNIQAATGSKPHTAQSADQNSQRPTTIRQGNMHEAYKILGVTSDMTEEEIRRAYKKLVGRLHPDKLMSQGLAQDHLNAATEQFKRIQMAYAFIKKHRSLYSGN